MERNSVVESLARVSVLSQNVIDSQKNANDLVDLQEYIDSDENIPLLKASIQSLSRVYSHLVNINYSWLASSGVHRDAIKHTTEAGDTADVTRQYRQWMKQNYAAFIERLLELLHHQLEEVQWCSLCSMLSLVETEGLAHQTTTHAYIYPNTLFHAVVSRLLDNGASRSDLIGRFSEYLKYDDVRYYWLKNIASIISNKVDQIGQNVHISQHFLKNCHSALKLVSMPCSDQSIGQFLTGSPPDLSPRPVEGDQSSGEEEEEREEWGPPKPKRTKRELKALNIRSLQKHRKQFSDAWLTFLRLPLTPSQRKQVLVSIHSDVIPHLMDPRLLLDFFTYSYDEGGVIGLLSLDGLFLLMNQHHLDYPDFYNKLYLLLDPSVFHVKYMQRFFYLLNTFLRSTHLALYLVAAFAKKISRLSLSAPPNGVMVGVVFVTNLIKRHPNCKVLLHRKEADSNEEYVPSNDTFDMREPDPAKCGALESSLWELKTLQSHYCPAVSKLVKQLLDPSASNSKVEVELGKYLDIDNDQLFQESCTDLDCRVPMNFQEPSSLWQTIQLTLKA